MMDPEALARELGDLLKERRAMLATAESCTGGWVGQVITAVPGSSHWYDRGFITYTNVAKREMLGVSTDILARFGAVSEPCARAMADGALARSQAAYTLAITGIAGPSGGTPEKPVGTVCFAWAGKDRDTRTLRRHFSGDRAAVRARSVEHALQGMLDFIRQDS